MHYFNSNIHSRFKPRTEIKPNIRNIASECIKPSLSTKSLSKNLLSSRLPHHSLFKNSSILSIQSVSNSKLNLTSNKSTQNILSQRTVDSSLPKNIKKSFIPKLITPVNLKKLEKFSERFEKITGKLKEPQANEEVLTRPKNLKNFCLSDRRPSGIPARFKELQIKQKLSPRKSKKQEVNIIVTDYSDPAWRLNPIRTDRKNEVLNPGIEELSWKWETPGGSSSKSVKFDLE